jgi:hypothetical protein
MLITYTFEIEVSAKISSALLVKVFGKNEIDCRQKLTKYLANLDITVGKCIDTHIIHRTN